MSSLPQEIATRARKLIKLYGTDLNSTVTGRDTARQLRMDNYYIRVRADGDLYINDMTPEFYSRTVFSQAKPSWEGKCLTQAACRKLREALRRHMLLEDLADV